MKRAKVLQWKESDRFASLAELQKPPKPRFEPIGQFWAGVAILTLCAALGYLFWTNV